jgi:hypothetical protein
MEPEDLITRSQHLAIVPMYMKDGESGLHIHTLFF